MWGWLLTLAFIVWFAILIVILVGNNGQRDIFPKLGNTEIEALPVGERSRVSRLLDEIVCAILGPTRRPGYGHGRIHPTQQQLVYVLAPMLLLWMALSAFLDSQLAMALALVLYVAFIATLAAIERVVDGPGTLTRPRTAGPVNPMVVGISWVITIALLLLQLIDWLSGLTRASI